MSLKILEGDKIVGKLNDDLEFTGDEKLKKVINRFRRLGFNVMVPGDTTEEKIVDNFKHLDFGPNSLGVLASELFDLGYDVQEV